MSDIALFPQTSQKPQASQFPPVFWVLLAVTAGVRLIGITRPLLGNFATKNVVYAMIARNFAHGNASIWYPTLDVLAGGERAWHMLEFPVSAYLTAGLWKALGGSLDVWGRFTAVAFSVASVAVMFLFVRRRHGQIAATAAGLALALAPVSVIYGQSFMLEASLVFFTLTTFYTLDRWLHLGHLGWLFGAGVCLALLLLTKIYMLVVLLPLGVMFLRSDRVTVGGVKPRSLSVYLPALLAAGLAIIPAVVWYAHAARTASPDGPFSERVFYSVRHGAERHFPPHPLLGSADFYRQVLDDCTGVVLTPLGFMLALAGLLDRRWRQYAAWLFAVLMLVLVLPLKFHQMNYYYMAVLPPLCILVGLGWQVVHSRMRPGRTATAVLLLVAVLLSFRHAFKPAFVTPEEDRGVVAAARALRELTDEDEPVVTIHGTSLDLLYYCDRPGWALDPDTSNLDAVLSDCRRQGARYVVVVGEAPVLQSLVAHGDNFRIHRP